MIHLNKIIQSHLFVAAFYVYFIYINKKTGYTFYISIHFIYINEKRAYTLYISFLNFLHVLVNDKLSPISFMHI